MQQIAATIKNISLKLNGREILRDINFELRKGEVTTLIGPNGGGKTSIARILVGILKPSKGEIFIADKCKIGYMPQKLIVDNTIPLRGIDFINLRNIKNCNLKDNKEKLMKRLEIESILYKSIHEISGGELQKLLLMGTLMSDPKILVLDEPTQFMDISTQAEFYQLIEEIVKQKDCAVLMISHDLHMVMQKTNRVICVNRHICCQGNPESISEHPEYLSLFGDNQINHVAIYSHHHDHKH